LHITAQIVDAVNMIGMRMRIEDRVDSLDVRCNHLLAKIRSGIDDDGGRAAVGAGLFDQQGSAAAAVFRVDGVARAPVAVDARHAGRRAAAKDGEDPPHRHVRVSAF
jgi:hypothetical protein